MPAYGYLRTTKWWMKRWSVRFFDTVPLSTRDTCERYGPDVIADILAGETEPATPDLKIILGDDVSKLWARDWLAERLSIQEYRDRWIPIRDLWLEIFVIVLIGGEIGRVLRGYEGGHFDVLKLPTSTPSSKPFEHERAN
jgi:hypothetical protein